MKAERRHELKENTLVHGIESLPEWGRQHGSKVLFAVVAALAIFLLVRNRMESSRLREARVATDISTARLATSRLRSVPLWLSEARSIENFRLQTSGEAEDAIQDALNNSDDPVSRGAALVVRGDLNWELANIPAFPEAATKPALNPEKTPAQLLDLAKGAYEEVLRLPLPSGDVSLVAARFGLASVAQNHGKWDEAKHDLQQISDDAAAPAAFKDLASEQLKQLPQISTPPLLNEPVTETQPVQKGQSVVPPNWLEGVGSSTQPAAAPATAPATAPALVPATAP